ncbi:hypothetical protein PJI17_32190, partial [Mycobacterium kansasii]
AKVLLDTNIPAKTPVIIDEEDGEPLDYGEYGYSPSKNFFAILSFNFSLAIVIIVIFSLSLFSILGTYVVDTRTGDTPPNVRPIF